VNRAVEYTLTGRAGLTLDNLYVVDASVLPTSAAVNPSLTIAALALRAGDHILQVLA
jgi:choline dehydrogenase-like flavoprotein